MSLWALIIVLELVVTTSIIGFSSHPQILSRTKHKISNVLGVKIAQENTSTPSDSSASDNSSPSSDSSATSTNPTQPTQDTTTPAPANSSPAPASPTDQGAVASPSSGSTSPSGQPSPTDQTNPSNPTPESSNNLFDQPINSSPTPQNLVNTSPNPQSSESTSPSPNPDNTNLTGTQAVLNGSDLINSPDNISDQSIVEAKKEDTQLTQTKDPADQTKLLINFATDKVKDMNNFTKADDFSSTNFAASRFNEQINQAINNLDKLPPKQQTQLKKQLANFCDQADQVLRTVELAVPEESEQDLQIARGQCQELNF